MSAAAHPEVAPSGKCSFQVSNVSTVLHEKHQIRGFLETDLQLVHNPAEMQKSIEMFCNHLTKN